MKKMPIMLVAGVMIFMLASCGRAKNAEGMQADKVDDIAQISKDADETGSDGKEDAAYDVLDNLLGEYDYTSDVGTGKLIIQKTSDGYDISDYESESSYRFLADSSNIETIKNNKIYIKYPEQVFSDGTVYFSYYILEYDTDGIDVYYGKTTLEETQFLYHAAKQNDRNTEHGSNEHSVSTDDEKFVDYEALKIKEYEYPSEFFMGDDLKTAIEQLALRYESFDRDTPRTGGWKEDFIAAFIQNLRVSFDYLDLISNQNNGQISIDELNYIQYSLTNTELDFSSVVNGSVDRYEAASSFNYGSISGYDYKDTDSGVLITADLEVGYDGTESTQKYEITAELVRNPYSCFDGYSVAAFSSKPITDNAPENKELSSEEAKPDLYEGEYSDYDVNQPALEIKKNDDETYQIQISIFRLWYFYDDAGKMTEDGLEFTATGPWEEEVNGIIKLEGDIATVTILGQAWLDFSSINEYKFYKTSDVPDIFDLESVE